MRWLALLVYLTLLCGCLSKQENVQPAEVKPIVYFSEDFSSGDLTGWDVESAGGGSIRVLDRENFRVYKAVEMRSQGLRSAYASAPKFDMDYTKDYSVSFKFMVPHRENYGYTVYRDRNIDIGLEWASGFVCVVNGRRELLGRIEPNTWGDIAINVRPHYGEYDVMIDGEWKKTCNIKENRVETFMFGDTDPMDGVYGDGLWDEFRITDRL
ncbi:MAG: hypothetical protein V1744_06565 [Candidatus Altiarchaeota archaeon]